MLEHPKRISSVFEYILPFLVLLVLGIITYAKFFALPYVGFIFESSNAEIRAVFMENPSNKNIKTGDQLLQIGELEWDDFQNNLHLTLFDDYSPGDIVQIRIERNNQEIEIPWVIPGWNRSEFLDRFSSVLILAYLFWGSGIFTTLFVRPKDERWRLMIAFFHMTALWLAAGSLSAWHLWGSAIFLRTIVWLCVPLYLHLHWVLPKPIRKLPNSIVLVTYALCTILAVLQIFQQIPENLYFLGFVITVIGSLVFLGFHFFWQKELRRDISVLVGATATALLPILIISIIGLTESIKSNNFWGYLAMPVLPGIYFIAAFRKRLGGMELRINRAVSTYVFLILLSATAAILISIGNSWKNMPYEDGLLDLIIILFAGIISAFGYPVFVRFFERHFLGIPVPFTQLAEKYTERITTSLDLVHLTHLLQSELLPSLFVRQSALLRVESQSFEPISLLGIPSAQLPQIEYLPQLISQAGVYRFPDDQDPFPWIRLILPLMVEGQLLGIWLFGQRDPDDYYSSVEIDVLKTIANQTVIALANILKNERFISLYEDNIRRHEEERKKLAHDLHDEILNGLAVLGMLVDDEHISTEFQKEYDKLTGRIRQIVSGLRPAMLDYGLYQAIDELIVEASSRIGGTIKLDLTLTHSIERYESYLEGHIYRIVQQALENAIQHAQAGNITISGELSENHIFLVIEDDGQGFESNNHSNIAQENDPKHYGLVVMQERAEVIGAKLQIISTPGNGTEISVEIQNVLQKQSEYLSRLRTENALFESEAKATTLMNATSDIIFLLDLDDIIIEANEAMARRVNKPIHDILGKRIWDFIPPKVAKFRKSQQDKVLQKGQPIRFEDKRAGRWNDNFIFPIKDSKGTITKLAVFSRDISDRKQAELALRESEITAKGLINANPDVVFLIDADGIILSANDALIHRFDKPSKDVIGACVWDLLKPEMTKQRRPFLDQVLRTGEPTRFEDERLDTWFDNIIYPIMDSNGTVTKLAIFARDITEQKRAQQALRENEENFRSLAENANDGILIADETKIHVYANQRAADITGYSIPELLKTNLNDLAHPEEIGKIVSRFQSRINNEINMKQYQTIILRKSGEPIPIEFTAAKTTWNGQSAVMVIIREITERK